MEFLYIAFAAFFVVTVAQSLVELHEVWWGLALFVASLAGLALCGDLRHWYGAVAISGIATMVLRVENLLIVKADETLVNIRRRRP